MPGESGNPKGRPPSKGLVNALREAVSQVDKTGRSVEQLLPDVLIFEAIKGKHRLAAINSIYDRLEGKPRTSIEVKSQSDLDISNRSSEEVECALALGCWPEDLKAMGHDPAELMERAKEPLRQLQEIRDSICGEDDDYDL